MAKTVIALLLIAAAAYFITQQVGRSPSEEEMMVDHLGERFDALVNKFTSASGRSGLIGIEATSDLGSVVEQILALRTELAELERRLTEEKAVRKADDLAEKIEYFIKKNEIKAP
jgi:hypothetical protein